MPDKYHHTKLGVGDQVQVRVDSTGSVPYRITEIGKDGEIEALPLKPRDFRTSEKKGGKGKEKDKEPQAELVAHCSIVDLEDEDAIYWFAFDKAEKLTVDREGFLDIKHSSIGG